MKWLLSLGVINVLFAQLLRVVPETAVVGDNISVYLEGFKPQATYTLVFDKETLTSELLTDEAGCATYSFTLKRLPFGEYKISAGEISSFLRVKTRIFKFEPTEGPVGTKVEIEGDGFKPNEMVQVNFAGIPALVTSYADESGYFKDFLTIPSASYGNNRVLIIACVPPYQLISRDFFVHESIENPQPQRTSPQEVVTMKGSGLVAKDTLEFRIQDVDLGTAAVEENGDFKFSFKLPQLPYGTSTLALSAKELNKTYQFLVFIEPKLLGLSPKSGHVGSEVTLKAVGLPKKGAIQIYFQENLAKEVSADDKGSLDLVFPIPPAPRGDRELKIQAQEIDFAQTITFTIREKIDQIYPETVQVGGTITIVASGFTPNQRVRIDIFRERGIAWLNTSKLGTLTVSIKIPEEFEKFMEAETQKVYVTLIGTTAPYEFAIGEINITRKTQELSP